MIRDITLGQYYASDSPIHRLDPRVKIIATLLFIIELFIVDNFIGFGICAAVLAAVIIVSRVPLSFIMRGLKPTIALRFIPTLLEETDKIMKAQQARGADFESGGLMKRAKALIPVLVPLFVSAFRIAQDLAMAMEARCYHGGENRTRMHEMKLRTRDFVAFALEAIFLALIIIEARMF